jgi:hypothetical protein
MMDAKKSAEKQLPTAAEILPVAELISLSGETPASPVAATRSQPSPRKKKTARKAPPWYKILVANGVLFAILCAAYLMLPGKNAKQRANENEDETSSRQSAESTKTQTDSTAHDLTRPSHDSTSAKPLPTVGSLDRKSPVPAETSEIAKPREELPQKVAEATPSVRSEPSKPPEPSRPMGPPKKHAVPSAEVREAMLAQLTEIYKDRKVNSLDEARKVINELRDLAAKTKSADEKFVLLYRVMQCACVTKDAGLMLHTIDEIGNDFQIEPLSVKEKMLVQFADGADRREAVERLFNSAQDVIDAAIAAERYETALSIASAVSRACQTREGKDWRSQAQSRRAAVDALRAHWQAFQDGEATLKTDPNDADANLAVGRWWCYDKGDWTKALPYFGKGSDDLLRLATVHDLKQNAGQLDDLLRLADEWRDAGLQYNDYQRVPVLRRAISYYERALGMMEPGLKKAVLEKRLADVKSATQASVVVRKVAATADKPKVESKPRLNSNSTGGNRTIRQGGVGNGAPHVTLTGPPYPESYRGAPTDKLSVQYAVIEVLKQVGLKYDFNGSRQRTDPVCRQWCRPNIANQPWPAALEAILGPVGLTYELNGDTVVLKRK